MDTEEDARTGGADTPTAREAGAVVVEKEMVKEALTEILGEIPALRALMKGKGPARKEREEAASAPLPRDPVEAGSSSGPVIPTLPASSREEPRGATTRRKWYTQTKGWNS